MSRGTKSAIRTANFLLIVKSANSASSSSSMSFSVSSRESLFILVTWAKERVSPSKEDMEAILEIIEKYDLEDEILF